MSDSPSPIKVGPFNLGMNNRLPDTEMDVPKVGSFLRSAVNVDITTNGTVKRRAGFAQSLPGTDIHSLWSDGDDAFMVDGTTLYRIEGPAAGPTKTGMLTGLKPGVPVSFTRAAAGVVCTEGENLYVLEGAAHRLLSVPMLNPEPTVSTTTGTLPAGTYQICFAYIADDMRVSGTTQPVQLTLGEGLGVTVTNVPALPAGIAAVAVYMTEPNGDELFLATTTMGASVSIVASPSLGGRCQTLNLQPLPGGSIVRHHNGRFFVARGKQLLCSEPFSTLYDPSKNFIQFPTGITVVEATASGLHVCTDTGTYFIGGDVATAELTHVLPYGAVPGTGGVYPDKNRAYWMSTRGLVQADGSGQVKNVQEAAIAMGAATSGAAMFREQDGTKQIVASLFGNDTTGATAYSFMDAEIVRKGITL